MQTKSQALPITKQILSSFCAAISAMMIKQFHQFELNQVLYFRSFFSIVIILIIIQREKLHVYGLDKSIFTSLFTRGVLGALGSFLYFQGLKLVLISESMLLNRTSPIWTSLIYIMVLKKEKFTLKLLVNMILCFGGIAFIALNKQQENSEIIDMLSNSHIIGLLLILTASIMNAFVNILVKSVSDKVESLILTLYQSFLNLLFVSMYSIVQESKYITPNLEESVNLLFMTIVSIVQGVLYIQSMKEGNLSVITNVSQLQIPFGYLMDFIVFKAQLNLSQLFWESLNALIFNTSSLEKLIEIIHNNNMLSIKIKIQNNYFSFSLLFPICFGFYLLLQLMNYLRKNLKNILGIKKIYNCIKQIVFLFLYYKFSISAQNLSIILNFNIKPIIFNKKQCDCVQIRNFWK